MHDVNLETLENELIQLEKTESVSNYLLFSVIATTCCGKEQIDACHKLKILMNTDDNVKRYRQIQFYLYQSGCLEYKARY